MRISDWSSDVCSSDLPAPSGGDLLSPGLGEAIAEAASDQRERRHELEATMALNAAVLAGLPDPLILVGESRRVLRLNPAAEALLGHDLRGRELALGIRNPEDRKSTRLNSRH